MWKRSFVATTVALGDTVDDALGALAADTALLTVPASSTSPTSIQRPSAPDLGAAASDLVARLRSPDRTTRRAALTRAVGEVVVAIDGVTLR